jgi:hypothetical protein
MILENKGAEIEVPFDGKGYSIPKGKFEVTDLLGRHIVQTMAKWGNKDIIIVDQAEKASVEPVEEAVETPAPNEEAEMAAQESEDTDDDGFKEEV